MNRLHALLASPLLAAAFAATPALAQTEPVYAQEMRPAASRQFAQAELDQILAPIALYPDALLSQVLMAATYPLEIVQAARWSRANPHLQGEDAVRAVQDRDWDPSVKSMVAFPQLLARMDERIEWTERLGEAFLAQEQHVMDTVQELRRRAYEAGNLRSSEEIVVRRESDYILIEPPAPDQVYVPYYDTRVVYGRWWWPQYEPIVWSPWSGYYYSPGYTAFGWGVGIPVGYRFFYGTFDWPRRHVRHTHHRPWYYHAHRWHNGERWRHDDARSHWRRDRHPAWRGDGDRRTNHDGRREWRDGDRWRDGDGRGRGRGERDGRRDDDGRDGRRDGDGRRAEGWRGQDARAAPSPAVRSAPVTPAPAPTYQAAPARGTPLPPRTSIGAQAPAPAPGPAAVPFGRPVEAQPAPRVMPAARSAPAPASAPVAVERSAPLPTPAPEREAREPAPTRESYAPRARER